MNKYYKPQEQAQVVRVAKVKRGWRAWDNERGLYRLCKNDEDGARAFYALELADGSLWESDTKIWSDAGIAPEAGASYQVRKDGKKTRVERWTERNEPDAKQLVREIATLLEMLERALRNEEGGAR